ncbi:MAG: response regulator transcription factor [Ileibacterium sp.]|nr:response regulator transcription factor [Ileibacterium sp.]
MKVLIVEDEYALADAVASAFERNHYQTKICQNGIDGAQEAASGKYDLVILDVMLPGMDGFDILAEIRALQPDVKVIMLTARGELDDKLKGLKNGANDYMTKPFHIEELLARADVQLKAVSAFEEQKLSAFDLELNLKNGELSCKSTGESIPLKGKEYELAEYILRQPPGQILSREQLYNRVWGWDNDLESNNLEAYLSFLRKKMKLIGTGAVIKAVRGMGYRLEEKK